MAPLSLQMVAVVEGLPLTYCPNLVAVAEGLGIIQRREALATRVLMGAEPRLPVLTTEAAAVDLEQQEEAP